MLGGAEWVWQANERGGLVIYFDDVGTVGKGTGNETTYLVCFALILANNQQQLLQNSPKSPQALYKLASREESIRLEQLSILDLV